MAEDTRLRRFAVLIDADNTSPRIAAGLFEEVAKFGEASVRRIYGDFSSPRMKSWADILQKYAIDPYQQFAYTTGKNASDIALVIDAMDLLHSRRFDGFCLVSSDSDFTRLASRLREEGADVYGFGARKTPESFRQACRRFIYIENLVRDAGCRAREDRAPQSAQSARRGRRHPEQGHRADGERRTAGSACGAVGQRLANIASDFDPRTYGFRKLCDLVRQSGAFEIDEAEGEPMRLKAKAAAVAGHRTPHPGAQATAQYALTNLRRSISAGWSAAGSPGNSARHCSKASGGRRRCRGAPAPRRRTAAGRGSAPWPRARRASFRSNTSKMRDRLGSCP